MSTSVPAEVAEETAAVTTLVRAMFPHESFPDGPYERCAKTIVETMSADPRLRAQLMQGLTELAETGFAGMGDADKLEYLHSISSSAFFQAVRGDVVTTLYNDPEIWEILGWEGESFSKGGYEDRGFNDLDWLPEARVEEPS